MTLFLFISVLLLIQVYHINGSGISCIPGVSKFGSGKGLSYYYDCPPGAEYAELVQCPHGNKWNRKSLMCEDEPPKRSYKKERSSRRGGSEREILEESPPETMTVPVLGRAVSLGSLYDARSQLIINSDSLWSEEVISESKLTQYSEYSKTDLLVENSQNDKYAKFSIDAELTLGFLGGLIEVEGAANYLRDSDERSSSVRLDMAFEAKTKTETLPTRFRRSLTYTDRCPIGESNQEATHVVSTLEYGMKAVFIFEQTVSSNETKEEVGGSLEVLVKAIPQLDISGKASLDLKGKWNKTVESMHVRMYGDYVVSEPPKDFDSAIVAYKEIIGTLKPKDPDTETHTDNPETEDETEDPVTEPQTDVPVTETQTETEPPTEDPNSYNPDTITTKPYSNSVPIMMTLTPIQEYCNDVQLFLASISSDLSTKASGILDDLDKVKMKLKTLMSTFLAKKFEEIKKTLNLFETNLEIYTTEVIAKVKKYLPKARSGGNEVDLQNLIVYHLKQPYSYDKAIYFLEERERELNAINMLFDDDMIRNGMIQIADYQKASILNAKKNKPYVFVFDANVLSDKSVTELFVNKGQIKKDTWYNNFTLSGLASNQWREFKAFVNINKKSSKSKDQIFFIRGNPLKENLLTEISVHMPEQKPIPVFLPIKPPPKPKVVTKDYDSVTLLLAETKNIENDHITEIFVKYRNILETEEADYQTRTVKIDKNKAEITKKIEILEPKNDTFPRIYTFVTSFQTSFCRGKYSAHLKDISPYASSEPRLKLVKHLNSNSVKLEWETPDKFPEKLDHPTYRVNISDGKEFKKSFTTEKMEKTITGLSHAMKYSGSVEIGFRHWMRQGKTAPVDFYTIPRTPDKPTKVKVDKYDITIELTSQNNLGIAENADFKNYQVTYHKIINDDREFKDIKTVLDKDNLIKISNLHPDTTYNFAYKVITSEGTSRLSPSLLVTTQSDKTELDKTNEVIEDITKEQDNKINSIIPLGTIMAWVNNIDKSGKAVPIPDGWQRCNGSPIKEPSIWAGKKTPNLNGEKRFLRGGDDVNVMKMEEDQLQDHKHIFIDPGHSHGYQKEYIHPDASFKPDGDWVGQGVEDKIPKADYSLKTDKAQTSINMGLVNINSSYHIALETQPKNMNVIYIMKVW